MDGEGSGVRRICISLTILGLAWSPSLHAESFVAAVGDYYKERSTRVIAPSIATHLELQDDLRIDGRFLVDQITSASGAFTVTDVAFTERRYEASFTADKKLDNDLRPSLSLKYSTESDYTSVLSGAALTALLNNDLTTVTGALQYQHDWISRRTTDTSAGARQQGADQFAEKLQTLYFSVKGSQVINPNFLVGATAKMEIMRGFLENVYRQEQHPRSRNDYAIGSFLRYRHPRVRLGFILETCLHASSWGHVGISNQLELWWTVNRWLDVVPFVRHFEQPNGTFFAMGALRPDPDNPTGPELVFNTQDPSLQAHRTAQVGARLIIKVKGLWDLQVMPSYYYRAQNTSYGNAHIAQLGLYWPLAL